MRDVKLESDYHAVDDGDVATGFLAGLGILAVSLVILFAGWWLLVVVTS